MPDGDRLHPSLGLSYQLPYLRLCQGALRPDEQARGLAERIKRDIYKCQESIVPCLRAVTARLEALTEALAGKTNADIDWRSESLELRNAAQTAIAHGGSKRDAEIVLQAAQHTLNDLEDGLPPPGHVGGTLCDRFVNRLYQSKFGDVVQTAEAHVENASPAFIDEQLNKIEPHILPQLSNLGKQLSQQQDREKLRLSLLPRRLSRIEDLESDILDVLR